MTRTRKSSYQNAIKMQSRCENIGVPSIISYATRGRKSLPVLCGQNLGGGVETLVLVDMAARGGLRGSSMERPAYNASGVWATERVTGGSVGKTYAWVRLLEAEASLGYAVSRCTRTVNWR